MINILHISDIHFGNSDEANERLQQLDADLRYNLNATKLDYVLISGDIAESSTKEEYDNALLLVDGIKKSFIVEKEHIVIVPGNHDVNWDLSADAYKYIRKNKLKEKENDTQSDKNEDDYIDLCNIGKLKRDAKLYKNRFDNFNRYFYEKVKGEPYPIEYSEQRLLHIYDKDKILVLPLNSSWNVDHHFKKRSGINMSALAGAFNQMLGKDYEDWLKIAIWHHPVSGTEMMNNDFMQQLATRRFQLCIHGHIHEAIGDLYRYQDKGIHIIGAGTFGAHVKDQVPGIPHQYNLLRYDKEKQIMTVETRKKEKKDGAWSGDPRWGDNNNDTSYMIKFMQRKTPSKLDMVKESMEHILPTSISAALPTPGKDQIEHLSVTKGTPGSMSMKLTDALLECQTMLNRQSRDAVVNNLRDAIRYSIERSNVSKIDVNNIVNTCINYPGGIAELISIVRSFENGAKCMVEIEKMIVHFSD
ncbi:MAG: metallophosphoesterase [Nitrospirae bacterium]|nr:metallophosphoesterase [Nitrospirota bacterium]